MSLLWLHPNQPERYVHLGFDRDSKSKVVFHRDGDAGTNPHGSWTLHPVVSDRCGAPYTYPSAVDPKSPMLAVRFNSRGVEEHSEQTLLGRIRGPLSVFIAIGTVVHGVLIRIYQDEEITAMCDFHIHAYVFARSENHPKFPRPARLFLKPPSIFPTADPFSNISFSSL